MSLHPLLPLWLVVPLSLLLIGLVGSRLVLDRRNRRGWLLRGAAAVLLCLALLGPAVSGGSARQAATDVNVWFVVDTTTSANARDYAGEGTRLSGYREDAAKIVEEMPGARFSVITFDQEARVAMPLTNDTTALGTAMETLRPEISAYSGGSTISAADETLREALVRSQERFPNRARVVFYLGDGEQTAEEAPQPFEVADLVDGGAVLGYGTTEGGPMATTNADGSAGDDVTGSDGEVGISVIDEAALEKIASEIDVPYVHREGGDIGPAMADADPGEVIEEAGDEVESYTSVVWVLALLAGLLLAVDAVLLSRDISRLRRAVTR